MRNVHDPDEVFPPSVEAGERFVFLSDCDVWDTTGGCAVYVFVQDYRPERPPVPNGLSHEGLMEAMQDGKTLEVTLDELVDHYIRTVFLPRRG